LHQHRGEWRAAQARAEALMALAREQGFPLWEAGGRILRGWALAEQGQLAEGLAQIQQGIAAWRATGAELGRSYYLVLLAEAYKKQRQAEAALGALAEALAVVHQHGERYWEAELHRLKGELLLLQAAESRDAEACFRQALDVAYRQGAKSLELRAALSLGRRWQRQGRRAESRQLLADLYSWFTEGFDTVDLQEAKGLLAALS